MIEALPLPAEITLESKAEVEAARAAYEGLTDEQKKLVTNLDKLEAAEAKIAELEADQAAEEEANSFKTTYAEVLGKTAETVKISDKGAVNTALTAYGELSEAARGKLTTEKALLDSLLTKIGELEKTEADQATADGVNGQINALPAVEELMLSNKAEVEAARAAYEGLTDEQKKLVTNLDKLEAAEAKIAELDKLEEAKATAATKVEEEYTIASWNILTKALALPETTIEEVAAKIIAINDAIAKLIIKADLTAYNTALAAVNQADYTVESWQAYQLVVDGNKVTTENTQEEVDAVTKVIIAAQANLIREFPKGLSGDNSITYFVNDLDYPWKHDSSIIDKVSFYPTNQGIGNSTSSFTCTVTGKGLLAYNYKLSAENNYDYLKIYVDDVLVKEHKVSTDWTSDYIILSKDTQTVKFEYKKDGSSDRNDDKVWIANLRLATGNVELTVASDNQEMGTVSGVASGTYQIGTKVTITATPVDSNAIAFVGWYDNATSEWLTGDGTMESDSSYTFELIENRDIKAVFKYISVMPELTLNHDSHESVIVNDGDMFIREFDTDSNKYIISLADNTTNSIITVTNNGIKVQAEETGDYTGSYVIIADEKSTIVLTSTKDNYVSTSLIFNIKVLYNLDGLVDSSSITNITNVKNDLDYPWKHDSSITDKVSFYPTNQGIGNSTSSFTCTVTGKGLLAYNYKVSAEDRYDYLKIYVDGVLVKEYKYSTDWASDYIIMSKDTQIVKFEYKKDSSGDRNDDKVWVANLGLYSGEVPLTLTVDGAEYGSINGTYSSTEFSTGVQQIPVGMEVKLNATVNSGATFYGWVDGNGNLLSTDAQYVFTMLKEVIVKAVFAPEGTYVARKNGVFYRDLAAALGEAVSGDTVCLIDNCTLNETTAVSEGVTLMIPYSATATSATVLGTTITATGRVSWTNESKYLYLTLTIPENITLNVNGSLIVGAVQHYPAQNYQGNTSGAYSQIICNGEINVNDTGVLDLYGLIKGNGTITAYSGSKLYQPFMIADYAGGTNTSGLFNLNQTPFNRYSMVNIQATLVMHYGSTMYGHASLYFNRSITTIDAVFVGDGGLIVLSEGATLTATYGANKYVDHATTGNNLNSDIGKTTLVISGGAKSGYMTFPMGINTSKVYFAIPYNYDIVLKNGNYNFEYPYKLMPGASLWVKNDATLEVTSGLYVYDGLIQSDMSGKSYPTTAMLQQYGFSPSANFIVDGTFIARSGKTFGGIVQTNGGGRMILEENANIVNETVTDGGKTSYDVNISKFSLPVRVYDADTSGLIEVKASNTYIGQVTETNWLLDSYTATYAKNSNSADYSEDIGVVNGQYHKWMTTTTTINQPMTGAWFVEVP